MPGELYTPAGETKSLLKEIEESKRPVTLAEVSLILSRTIKHDETNKLLTFLGMLLTFTKEEQLNIGYTAESSTGKSYIAIEISLYFPEETVLTIGYASPTAFFHDYGEWDNEEKVKIINLHQKILLFLDQPHDQLLQRLRPLLSHDKKEILHKITDRTKAQSLSTKNVRVIGYPTVVFCTALSSQKDQEKTRLLLLSPETTSSKLRDSILLLADKLRDREHFKRELQADPYRKFLKDRVTSIRAEGIEEIIISSEDMEYLLERFHKDHPHLIPRNQRDFPRLVGIIKALTLLNCFYRPRIDGVTIQANREDVDEGYRLYSEVSEANERGLSPEIYEIYMRLLKPNITFDIGWTKKEIAAQYYLTYYKTIGGKRLDEILDVLQASGFLREEYDLEDKRLKRFFLTMPSEESYSHPEGYIVGTQNMSKLNTLGGESNSKVPTGDRHD